ncbi:dihydroxyacetone kinase subunit DhaL [Fonticella tunisiensis]|uniref:phosphoenolpyruvate--glycerone phosphotransferase n=1 Tax=Fonticella tunisiensis TaxID=1096341 RepID=A0A4R7K8R2_9CLOT|nr:dihydroxyacetone kinase subunit DhaL [Fonticella tunisiensis]TDT50349.1 dihydroxyacetone kinase DhaL subunit [Fonticella tunisiensis]
MYEDFILDKAYFIKVIKDLAEMIEENRDYLTGLDSEIGDGDHGTNLSIGFREVMKNLGQWENENLTVIFKKVGMALLGKVGGASGPLYGSMFMKLGEPAHGKERVNFKEFYEMFKSGIEAVENRGKAVVGDKTMVDALRPGLNAFTEAIESGEKPEKAFGTFLERAKEGSQSTIPLIARKGRAMRLGERAIGHMDPGSASSCMILEVFYRNLLNYKKNY